LLSVVVLLTSCAEQGSRKEKTNDDSANRTNKSKTAQNSAHQAGKPARGGSLSQGLAGKRVLKASIFGAPAGKNTVQLAKGVRKATIHPLFYYTTANGKAGGSMGKARIKVEPNPTGEVSVGVFEQFAGGAGNQWRAAVFMASFLSSVTLGRLLTDFQFSVHCSGRIDGPSAGGLMSAGILAAMTGAPINPKATMTGTINPDGTIGPVGGIPQKFRAAAQKGKTVLGYPVGQRMNKDLALGRKVDLHGVAKQNGAQAREVRDIYDAYNLLTGKFLPRPTPLAPARLALNPQVKKAVQKMITHWTTHTQKALQGFAATGVRNPALTAHARKSQRKARSALQLAKIGQISAAYQRALESAVLSTITVYGATFVKNAQARNLRGILAELNKLSKATQTMDALAEKLSKIKPQNLNEFTGLLFAFSYTVEAIATSVAGAEKYKAAKKMLARIQGTGGRAPAKQINALMETLMQSTIYLSVCYIMASAGTQIAQISAFGGGKALQMNPQKLGRLAQMYFSAAATNLKYFDSIVLEPLAKKINKSSQYARQAVMDKSFTYLLATLSMQLGSVIKKKWGDTAQAKMALLAASLTSYLTTSTLVAEEYSLGVKRDGNNNPVAVRARKAFLTMLTAAEKRAREHAAAAQAATGMVPVGAKVSYRAAKAYVSSNALEDKLEALSLFWTSSVVSQLAVMIR
jgi:predicted S18 family serine protease